MNSRDFLESILSGNPLTLPLVLASQALGGSDRDKEKSKAQAPSSTPSTQGAPTPPPSSPSTTPDLPTQQPVPPGGVTSGDLLTIIRELEKIKQREAEAAREFYPTKAQIDLETYRQQAALAEQAGLEKMRQKTARDIELQTINAWQGITQAQINRDAMLGIGMMNLAYTAGMPNPNILQGGASLAGQGRASFGTPTSVIS